MPNSLQGKNAAEVTHYLKEVVGNGSMKRGIQKLLDESIKNKELAKQLENSVRSGKLKNMIILGLALKIGNDFIKKKRSESLKEENNDLLNIKQIKDAVDDMTDDEIENLVEESLEETADIECDNNEEKA